MCRPGQAPARLAVALVVLLWRCTAYDGGAQGAQADIGRVARRHSFFDDKSTNASSSTTGRTTPATRSRKQFQDAHSSSVRRSLGASSSSAATEKAPADPASFYRSHRFYLGDERPDTLPRGVSFVPAVGADYVERHLETHIVDHSYLNPIEWYTRGEEFDDARKKALGLNGFRASSPSTVARTLTHRRAWMEIVSRNVDYGVIFEAGAVFQPPAATATDGGGTLADPDRYVHHVTREMSTQPKWEVVNLGRCRDYCSTDEEIRKVTRRQSVVWSMAPSCAHAYVVSRLGAKKLLQWSLPYVLPVDVLMPLLTRRRVVGVYATTPPFFALNVSQSLYHSSEDEALPSIENDGEPFPPECEPNEDDALDHFGGRRLVDDDSRILTAIQSSWISTWVRDTFSEDHRSSGAHDDVARPRKLQRDGAACRKLDDFCEWVRGDDAPGPEEKDFVARMDAAGLTTFVIWGLSMAEHHTHRFIHEALHQAARRAFETSPNTKRRLCWVPSSTELCPADATIDEALVFGSPKHMTYTADPGLTFLRPSDSSRYIFHELTPPHFLPAQSQGHVVQWVVAGPDGSSPVHEAEHFALKEMSKCGDHEVTCFTDDVYVAPWASRYRPDVSASSGEQRALDARGREQDPFDDNDNAGDPVLHFVGTIWWLNRAQFCELVAGCNEVGVRVIRHGMSQLPPHLCDGSRDDEPKATFEDDWRSLSDEEASRLNRESLFSPVFQGRAHLDGANSYVSDRTFDTVAHGMRVITNNPLSAGALKLPFAEARDMCRVNQETPIPPADPLAVAKHTYLSRLNEMLSFFAP